MIAKENMLIKIKLDRLKGSSISPNIITPSAYNNMVKNNFNFFPTISSLAIILISSKLLI